MADREASNPDVEKEEAILQAALRVFAREGFRGTDVQVIADEARVGKGTVYRYFGDKQALFLATVYWVLQQLDRAMTDAVRSADHPLAQLRAACSAYGHFFAEHPDYLEIFVLDRAEFRGQAPEKHRELHERMILAFGEIVRRGIAEGSIPPIDVRTAIVTLGSTLYGAVVFAAYAKLDESIAETAKLAGELFLRGIQSRAANPDDATSKGELP